MSRKEVIKIMYEDIKDLQENDIIQFAKGPRYYYGRVIYRNGEKYVVALNNDEQQFKLTECSKILKIETKGGEDYMTAKKKVTKKVATKKKVAKEVEPVQKVTKLTRASMDELGGKIVKFMLEELKISKENLLGVNRRAWLQLKEVVYK